MDKNNFLNGEIQESVFSDFLKLNLMKVLKNDFFTTLKDKKISLSGYQFFVKEKYSSIGYFIKLLENAENLSKNVSENLVEVFKSNRLDELGYFAGEFNEEYKHETWRQRTLASFEITDEDIKEGLRLESSKKHEEIMIGLSNSQNAFEVIGALLFLELFVVYEMKSLISAFERDLPNLFPQNEYSYDKFPFNTQEYWYGHSLHDTWHFRAIEEALMSCLKNKDTSDSILKSLFDGIEKVAKAKNYLYSKELITAMLKV